MLIFAPFCFGCAWFDNFPYSIHFTMQKSLHSSLQILLRITKRFKVCAHKSESGRWKFDIVVHLRDLCDSPLLSGFCRQKKTFNMAMGEGDYKDFGPLVGAIDQGTSSSRFLVSCTSIKKRTEFSFACKHRSFYNQITTMVRNWRILSSAVCDMVVTRSFSSCLVQMWNNSKSLLDNFIFRQISHMRSVPSDKLEIMQ